VRLLILVKMIRVSDEVVTTNSKTMDESKIEGNLI
jgi:hypothetical protein